MVLLEGREHGRPQANRSPAIPVAVVTNFFEDPTLFHREVRARSLDQVGFDICGVVFFRTRHRVTQQHVDASGVPRDGVEITLTIAAVDALSHKTGRVFGPGAVECFHVHMAPDVHMNGVVLVHIPSDELVIGWGLTDNPRGHITCHWCRSVRITPTLGEVEHEHPSSRVFRVPEIRRLRGEDPAGRHRFSGEFTEEGHARVAHPVGKVG